MSVRLPKLSTATPLRAYSRLLRPALVVSLLAHGAVLLLPWQPPPEPAAEPIALPVVQVRRVVRPPAPQPAQQPAAPAPGAIAPELPPLPPAAALAPRPSAAPEPQAIAAPAPIATPTPAPTVPPAPTVTPTPQVEPTPAPSPDPLSEAILARFANVERGCGDRQEGCYSLPGGNLRATVQELEESLRAQGYEPADSYSDSGVRVFQHATEQPRYVSFLADGFDTYIVTGDQPLADVRQLTELR